MRIIARRTLKGFVARYPDAEAQLDAWWSEAKAANWKTPADIKQQYGTASILKGGRVVFNICGNKYRLVVAFDYKTGVGYIKFIGTHKEYDLIDVETV